MAKCIIIFEDEGNDLSVKVELDPPVNGHKATYAQSVGWTFFKKIQEALEVKDEELLDHNQPQPPE